MSLKFPRTCTHDTKVTDLARTQGHVSKSLALKVMSSTRQVEKSSVPCLCLSKLQIKYLLLCNNNLLEQCLPVDMIALELVFLIFS